MRAIQLDTDCEGPLCLNDNAFELCRDFLRPDGDRFFTQVSRYDDYLVEVLKRPGYKAGDTLKLILPFLKAYGLTNKHIFDYSLQTILLMPDVDATYSFLRTLNFPVFMISTSYRQFARAVGLRLGFPESQIFCTELDLDRYLLKPAEAERLKQLKAEIAALPLIEVPGAARSGDDQDRPTQEAIARLDQIFWNLIPEMAIGAIYQDVNPIGGVEKERALMASLARTGLPRSAAVYIGDSITDVQTLQALRAGGGLAVSFNGNRYAVDQAEVIVVADTAWPVALIAAVFMVRGKEGVLDIAEHGRVTDPASWGLPTEWTAAIAAGLQGRDTALYVSNNRISDEIAVESAAMRTRLRGAAIAALG